MEGISVVVYEDDLLKVREGLERGLNYFHELSQRDDVGNGDDIYRRDLQCINDAIVKVDVLLSNFKK